MNAPTNLRSALFFLGLPVLWWGSFSVSGQVNSSTQQAADFDFIPVAIHAAHTANYGVDTSTNKYAPVDIDIIDDVMSDQGIMPPLSSVIPTEPKAEEDDNFEDTENHSGPYTQPAQDPSLLPDNPVQSGVEDGNKDKDQDSPGQSGDVHGPDGDGADDKDKDKDKDKGKNDGNKDDEVSPGNSGEEHGPDDIPEQSVQNQQNDGGDSHQPSDEEHDKEKGKKK